jgi:chromosome segregation protein
MRIKKIVIQGFKTFARRTEFVFDPGVTAIVGPNGSGKSNIADAVRWCLGEQSFGLLRSKKTADVIFSGSDKKARLSMATVSLTLDNSDGELPIDFTEVEIARRAYRDGENEYLLNGQRVRLQDITELLAPSGLGKRTYAVIGQGLIDQVLSLKPEERRTLFEEAAGITGYQSKRATALRRLDATQQNLERVQDIIAEISPRLKYLKRQAERARERDQIEADLQGLLRQWYGYRWHHVLDQLKQHRATEESTRETVAARQQRLSEIGARIEELRATQGRLRSQLNELHLASSEKHREAEKLGRQLAVAQERRRQLQARQEEMERELAQLRVQQETVAARIVELRQSVEDAQISFRQQQDQVRQLQLQLDQRQQERGELLNKLEESQQRLRRIREQIADRRSRLEQVAEQRSVLQSETQGHEQTLQQIQAKIQELAQEANRAEAAQSKLAAEEDQLREQMASLQAQVEELRRKLEAAETVRVQADRAVDRLQTRYDLLARLRNEGAGYASGVRAVLQANGDQLSGILGTVASQLHVPAELDKAIETALGGAFQNVITESWDDAQRAVEYLKQSRQGRATFLPLERLYVPNEIPAPNVPGILGNAVHLVHFDQRVAPAAQQLLNRVWVADSLESARRALDTIRGGPRPTVVTVTGEIVRPGGAITGGSDNRRRDDSVLAREREFRELPQQLEEAQKQASQAREASLELAEQLERNQAALEQAQERRTELARQIRQQQQQLDEQRMNLAQAQQRAGWQQERIQQIQTSLEQLDTQEQRLRAELATLSEEERAAQETVTAAEATVSSQSVDALLKTMADLRAAAAQAQGHLRSQEALLENQRRSLRNMEEQIQSKAQRLTNLEQEIAALTGQIDANTQVETGLSGELNALQAEIDPIEAELHKLEEAQKQAEANERHLQHLLRQDETAWNGAQLQLQRTEDALENLRREIAHDFGLADMEKTENVPYQPPLPLSAIVQQLPILKELPVGLEEEVTEMRARLRRLSNVNPDAPKEYDEAAGRHQFLLTQSEDLEAAAMDLRKVIRELDSRMEAELKRTFEAVSREFVHFFKLLFNGGAARLTLTDPDDIINTGIEIVARPPGKRPQSLALLSGGERSLTACALIFAILRVSPTPFCILDEVDAALDEANVDRFREVLEGLDDQTQFILITHNRRTLEASNTIYGITMGDDGVSRVISLRLEGDTIVRDDGSQGEAPVSLVSM